MIEPKHPASILSDPNDKMMNAIRHVEIGMPDRMWRAKKSIEEEQNALRAGGETVGDGRQKNLNGQLPIGDALVLDIAASMRDESFVPISLVKDVRNLISEGKDNRMTLNEISAVLETIRSDPRSASGQEAEQKLSAAIEDSMLNHMHRGMVPAETPVIVASQGTRSRDQ